MSVPASRCLMANVMGRRLCPTAFILHLTVVRFSICILVVSAPFLSEMAIHLLWPRSHCGARIFLTEFYRPFLQQGYEMLCVSYIASIFLGAVCFSFYLRLFLDRQV